MFNFLSQRPLRAWLLVFVLLNLIDLGSTFLILQQHLIAGNLLAEFLLHDVGIYMVMAIKTGLIILATFAVQKIAQRSAKPIYLACNILIALSGLVLILITINVAQCALTYF